MMTTELPNTTEAPRRDGSPLTEGLGAGADCKRATPHGELLAQLMDPNAPKSEREHAAAREIDRLRGLLDKAHWPFPSGGTGGGLTQCDMHDDESS